MSLTPRRSPANAGGAHQYGYADGVLPPDQYSAGRQRADGTPGAIAKSYSSKGQELVERNWQALALARESLFEVPLQPVNASSPNRPPVVSDAAPDFVKTVTAAMLAGLGDTLPVSALPPDGTGWARPAGKTQHCRSDPYLEKSCAPSATTAWRPARTRPFAPKWCHQKR